MAKQPGQTDGLAQDAGAVREPELRITVSSPTSRRPSFGFLATLFVLCAALPALLLPTEWHPSFTLLLVAVMTVYAGARLAMTMWSSDRSLLRLGLWLYVYVWFGVAALLQVNADRFPNYVMSTASDNRTAALLNLVGVLVLDAAMSIPSRRATPAPRRELDGMRVKIFAVVSIVVSIVMLQRIGGLQSLLTSRQAFSAALSPESHGLNTIAIADKSGLAFKELLLDTPVFLAAYCMLILRHRGVAFGALGVVTLAVTALVNNPIAQPRQWAGTVFIALLLAWRGRLTKHGFRVFAAVLIASLLILFPFGNRLRYTGNSDIVAQGGVSARLTVMPDYDSFQQVGAAVGYAGRHGYSKGSQSLLLALFWVPRADWKGKPYDAGSTVGKDIGYASIANTNLSCPITAQAYMEFGFPFLVVAMFGLGRLYRRAEDFVRNSAAMFSPVGTLVGIVAFYQLMILRGPLLPIMGRSVALFLMLYLVTKPIGPVVHNARRFGLRRRSTN